MTICIMFPRREGRVSPSIMQQLPAVVLIQSMVRGRLARGWRIAAEAAASGRGPARAVLTEERAMAANPRIDSTTYRCWICLDDSDTLEGMVAPCRCVGTNRFVHESCVKTYALQHLTNHEPSSAEMNVSCPICRSPYRLVEGPAAAVAGSAAAWDEYTSWATDKQVLLRQSRFCLLVIPLVVSSLVAWSWLFSFWLDLYQNGPGEPLMDNERSDEAAFAKEQRAFLTVVHDCLVYLLPSSLFATLEELLVPLGFSVAPSDVVQAAAAADALDDAGSAVPHPAGISQKWSRLYVSLQYAQWYKVLAWLIAMVVGGMDGVFPPAMQEAFRVDELLLASERRAGLFLKGQCVPFVATKVRHFLVTCARRYPPIKFLFYSLFSSHAEVACNVACDSISAVLLVRDWIGAASNDLALRRNMRRLRTGNFTIAPYHAHDHAPAASEDLELEGTGARSARRRPAHAAEAQAVVD